MGPPDLSAGQPPANITTLATHKGSDRTMANTFKVGDMTVHRIVEMECGFTPALEFLPGLKPEVLAENRSWMNTSALDADDNLVLCLLSYIVRTGRHTVLVDSCVGIDKH